VLAVLSPGQGSQKPGFLTPWLELPGSEARLRWWSVLAGVDLLHLGTQADADEIKDTARTQPLLVAAALLAGEQLALHDVGLVAGHSVGELGASALAGVLSAESAIALAGIRGREMAAVRRAPGACAGLPPRRKSAVHRQRRAPVGGPHPGLRRARRLTTAGVVPANPTTRCRACSP